MLFVWWTFSSAAIVFGQAAAGFSDPASSPLGRDESRTSVLTAVNVQSKLERREVNFGLKYACEHHYVDHVSLLSGASARFAKTSMNFRLPTLDLESIEIHLENIQCSDSAILIEFADDLLLREAKEEWDSLSEFTVITSHPGCNGDGERAPYVVSNITYKENGLTALLSVERVEWKAVYDSLKVDFGVTDQSPYGQYSISDIRSHDRIRRRLGRRQAAASSTTTFPSAPSITPTSDSSIHDIGFTNFDPAFASVGDLTIGCKNCTVVGTIEITQGTFFVNSSISDEYEEAYHFIEHGYFDFVGNGIGAHIELETSVSVTASFAKTFVVITLPGFQIPGIAAVGPQFRASLTGSVEISNAIDFTYGFDLSVPDGSSINFDIGNLTNSSSQGFSQSKLTAIPLAASSENIAATFTVALHAAVLLGIDILSNAGSIEAGAFIDLPALSVTIASVSNVNADCESLNSSSPVTGFLSHVFPELTNIAPSVNLDIGLYASASLSVPAILATRVSGVDFGTSVTLTETSFPLQTACLSWDSEATAFVKPTFTSTTSSMAAPTGVGSDNSQSGGHKNFGAQLRDQNPIAQKTGIACATAVMFGFILAFAVL